jgi:hypothetical protein
LNFFSRSGIPSLLERYARIFDAGTITPGVSQIKSKSYYWVVSAEIAFYANKDVEKASQCLMKAAEFDPENIQWRIILSKLLLERFKDLLSNGESSLSFTVSTSSQPKIDETPILDAIQVTVSFFVSSSKHIIYRHYEKKINLKFISVYQIFILIIKEQFLLLLSLYLLLILSISFKNFSVN